jgi:rod shape-determining protein MreC
VRLRKRHAWGAVLIVLFALPVLKPRGVAAIENPTGGLFAWFADVLPTARPWADGGYGASGGSGSDGQDAASERVRQLEDERSQLWELHLRTKQRLDDLGELKAALQHSELDRRPKALMARVLRAHDASSLRRSILIDRGTEDGVRVGHPVVMGSAFIGRVRVARRGSSLVQLVTDPYSRLEVFVRTSTGKLLRGYAKRAGSKDGRDSMVIEFVRLRDDVGVVRPKARVFTSNFDERVPAHLLVGHVDEVSDPDRDKMPKLTMRPAMDLDRSTEVVVLLPQDRAAGGRSERKATAAPRLSRTGRVR